MIIAAGLAVAPATANGYREHGKPAKVAGGSMTVTPARDWNKLSIKPRQEGGNLDARRRAAERRDLDRRHRTRRTAGARGQQEA
jgi:hypothetical protein